MIHHLSFPADDSLKDSSDKEMSSVCYSTSGETVTLVRQFGPWALMAKADVQCAFGLSIHPSSFSSLGFQFEVQFYIDKCLAKRCSLSCYYFEAFSSFI